MLELRAVTKRYSGLAAVDAVSLQVRSGEIHAVLGENGAGKSTLMKIACGAVQPDSGEIRWRGATLRIAHPAAGRRLGIGMVHQHFSLCDSLSVVDNIAVALDERYDPPRLARRIAELGARYGLEVDPRKEVHTLSVGERQRVEILRCLLQRPALLILDEPTAVLTPQGVRGLFEVLRKLAAEGCSILYISHKLQEIRELCDVATVMRNGAVVATAVPRDTDSAQLAALMVGGAVPSVRRGRPPAAAAASLEVDLSTARLAVSCAVHGGEILGIAGVSGNGQAELAAALCGEVLGAPDSVRIDGRPVGRLGVAARRRLGLSFVPEERLGRGAVPDMTLADNTLLSAHARLVRRGFIDRGRTRRFAATLVARFEVKCSGPLAPARTLSGGNLQKFIVGRELALAPRILIIAQPTWGVDVAAAAVLRQHLLDLSRGGAAVLAISENLDELFDICDRIAVMYRGTASPARAVNALDAAQIGLMMSGA